MRQQTIWSAFLFIFFALPLFSQELKVGDVVIKGNRRIEADAILNQVTTQVGSLYSPKDVRKSIENIYRMGFFEDVAVEFAQEGKWVTLTYWIKEKPAIRTIEYRGYKKVDLSAIKEAVNIKEYSILDPAKIKEAQEKIIKLYEQKGFFLAQVTYALVEHKKTNEVDLSFDIEELDKIKIRKINFIGNHSFSEDRLKNAMATKEKGFLTWLTKSDNYQEEVLKGDIEGLLYFYHTHGYVQVKIDPPLITVSPDKKWIYISLYVEEGSSYEVGDIDYSGDLLISRSNLTKESKIESNRQFNRDLLRQEVLRLADLYKDEGYAFANVNVKSNIRDDVKKVDLTFDFEKGQKVYIGNINILGNTSTRDKVIRRELKISEGDLYHESNLRKSIDKVRALGYFSEVTYTKPQGSAENRVDINVSVKERSTGALQVGAGYSSIDSFIANAQLSHTNLFGRGQEVSFNAQISTGKRGSNRFSTSFTEPYTLDSLWNSGFDGYNMETRAQSFTEQKVGGDIRVGHPLGESMNTYLTYKLESIRLKDISDPKIIQGGGLTSSMLGTWVLDRRNNRYEPSKGYHEIVSTEIAGFGGDNYFTKSVFKSRFYYPFILNGVFRVNSEFGFLQRTTSKVIPTSERFILGGINTLRGFDNFSIGPAKTGLDGKRILVGGDRQLFGNMEYEIPLILAMGLKGVLFYDAGTVFNGSHFGRVRHNVGFGFRWFSPFGPLRFEIGFPIDPKDGEKKYVPSFAITPPF